MKRIVSDREEREIEALYQQNRTSAWPVNLPFESDADRLARLQYELERRDRQWVERESRRREQDEKQVPLKDVVSVALWLGIIVVGTAAFWLMVAVFVFGGRIWPR